MKRTGLILLCCLSVLSSLAQNPKLRGQVDQLVHVDENFHLRYTLNSREGENFTLGTLPNGIEKIFGPSQSVSISSQTINGHTTRSEEVTLTYILSASKTGQFTIPPAQVTVNGHVVKSEPLTVHVIDGQQRSQGQPQPDGAATTGRAGEFFVSVIASKQHVMENEPLLLTYKVCWHPDLSVNNIEPIKLELQNVFMQAYNDTQQKSVKLEEVNGKTYVTVDWQQYVIYPQKPGTLTIPAIDFKGYVRQELPIDPFDFDPFTSSNYREVTKQLHAKEMAIRVDALPERPAGFSNGVGHFTMTASIDKNEVKENIPITITCKVKGTGNLSMVKEPVTTFPPSFDIYDTKSTENYKLTANGLDGEVTFELVAVPQKEGNYTIPPVQFTYYDISAKAYRTLSSDPFELKVEKGAHQANTVNDFTSQEEVETLGNDIRHIKMGPDSPQQRGYTFFGSTPYLIALATMLLLFVSLFVAFRKRALDNADIVKLRGKKANKVATRRLKKAASLMRTGKASEFYDEVLRALWGYIGDKLNMPASQLSPDNISDRLREHGADDETIGLFQAAIDECEFERYAPGDPTGNMNKVYEKSMTAIEQIEKGKKVKKRISPKATSLCLLFLLPLSALAATKTQADAAYSKGDYQEAITLYEEVLKQGESPELYYNLGNAYYRTNDITHAILNYERSLLLSPGDADTSFNLQMARSKTIDKIAPESEMFFITWYKWLVNRLSVDGWARTALVGLALAIILALVYLFCQTLWLRKLGFFGGIFMLVLFLLSNLFAWQQKRALTHRDGAIIMETQATVKSTPSDGGTDLFILHAGTKVRVVDGSMKDWKEIRLPDGKQGWIETNKIEII